MLWARNLFKKTLSRTNIKHVKYNYLSADWDYRNKFIFNLITKNGYELCTIMSVIVLLKCLVTF